MINKTAFTNFPIYIIPILVCFFNVLIILFPQEIITASKNGLLLWFNNVVPSLLPFIIGTNLLINLGFIDFLGTFTEKLMIKFFNISGKCAFALIMGMLSGYPIGSKITADLLRKNDITKSEAERLITFTNNSGPLFILGTVAVTMLGNIKAGIVIILSHYVSSLTIGIFLGQINKIFGKSASKNISNIANGNLILKAFRNLKKSREKENNTFGSILSSGIKSTTETILSIGGFVILFSVISEALNILGIFNMLEKIFIPIFNFFDIDIKLLKPIFMGILEITNGCRMLSEYELNTSIVISACLIISWGGFSIHAQSISFLSGTGIKTGIYFISKIFHSILSAVYSFIIIKIFGFSFEKQITSDEYVYAFLNLNENFFISSTKLFIFSILIIILTCILYCLLKHVILKRR